MVARFARRKQELWQYLWYYAMYVYHQRSDSVARWYVFSSVCLWVGGCVCHRDNRWSVWDNHHDSFVAARYRQTVGWVRKWMHFIPMQCGARVVTQSIWHSNNSNSGPLKYADSQNLTVDYARKWAKVRHIWLYWGTLLGQSLCS